MKKEEKYSNKCPICGRPTHKESKYCIFHASAKEKTEEEFKKALKKYVNEIKKEDGVFNFMKFIFVGNINFKEDLKITIIKNANFMNVIFKGNANFEGTTFGGYDDFEGTIFKGNADFRGTTFKGNAYFWGTTFEGHAYFRYATFEGHAYFEGTTFEGDANFEHTTFWGDADFEHTTFWGDADFVSTTFKGDAYFLVKYFVKAVTFAKVSVLPGKKLNLTVMNNKGNVSFERAHLENTFLDIELVEGILIDFTDALLRNTKIQRDQIENHILQEEKKEFSRAQKIYLCLKNNFHSIGQYGDESWAFTKEKDMERMSESF